MKAIETCHPRTIAWAPPTEAGHPARFARYRRYKWGGAAAQRLRQLFLSPTCVVNGRLQLSLLILDVPPIHHQVLVLTRSHLDPQGRPGRVRRGFLRTVSGDGHKWGRDGTG